MGVIGLLLVPDLRHPFRFWLIVWRLQWESWRVKAGIILLAYSALLAAHLVPNILGATGVTAWLGIIGVPLAVASSIYTAWLFGQAKA